MKKMISGIVAAMMLLGTINCNAQSMNRRDNVYNQPQQEAIMAGNRGNQIIMRNKNGRDVPCKSVVPPKNDIIVVTPVREAPRELVVSGLLCFE